MGMVGTRKTYNTMSVDMVKDKKLTINNFDRLLNQRIYYNYVIYVVDVNDDVYKMEATYYHSVGLPPQKIHIHIHRRISPNNIILTKVYWVRMSVAALSNIVYVPLGEIRDMSGWLEYMGEEVRKLAGM